MARNYYQGRFKPKNPKKYSGDPTNIIYRSGWELKFMQYVDDHPEVVQWASEELVIPYKSPIDGRYHRYFTDFVIKKKSGEVFVIEVKPAAQTVPPKETTKSGKKKPKPRFIEEVKTWGINSSKWNAAQEYCKDRGWKFVIMTEHDLNIGK